jgi:para-nitrobenzyl esterase
MQDTTDSVTELPTMISEDCLFLNVFTPPNINASAGLPVIVWVHGGGFQIGGANESWYDGSWDAASTNNVVMVTLNYRLAAFGYLAGKALRSLDPAGGTGNAGILDQRAALQWVHDNIRYFGGDPKLVLLAGQSAGGVSVTHHLVREKSWGLFQRATIQSGGYAVVPAADSQQTPDEFEKIYSMVLNVTGCAHSNSVRGDDPGIADPGIDPGIAGVKCLQALDAKRFLAIPAINNLWWEPVVDGVDLTEQLPVLLSHGKLAPNVPVMLGANREDAGLLPDINCSADCTETDFTKFAEKSKAMYYPALNVTRMVQLYAAEVTSAAASPRVEDAGNYSRWYWAAVHAGADVQMVCSARRTARWVAHAGSPAYLYHFAHTPVGPSGFFLGGAHHSAEIPFVFHVLSPPANNAPLAKEGFYLHGTAEVQLSTAMVSYWRCFALTGDPSGRECTTATSKPQPPWPVYRYAPTRYKASAVDSLNGYNGEGDDQTMLFGYKAPSIGAVGGLKRAVCDFWDALAR